MMKSDSLFFHKLVLVCGLVFFALNATGDQTRALHKKVSKMLKKHAVTLTSGNVIGYKTKTNFHYKAKSCALYIDRHLEWHHLARGTSTTDSGASYTIPLNKVQLDKGEASNRLKLSCQTDDCIAKKMHKRCKSRRYCRRNKTINTYYLQVNPETRLELAHYIEQLVSRCGAPRTASTTARNRKITY